MYRKNARLKYGKDTKPVFDLAKAYQRRAATLGLTDLQIALIDAFIKQMF